MEEAEPSSTREEQSGHIQHGINEQLQRERGETQEIPELLNKEDCHEHDAEKEAQKKKKELGNHPNHKQNQRRRRWYGIK